MIKLVLYFDLLLLSQKTKIKSLLSQFNLTKK